MLLDGFDNNPNFHGDKFTIELKKRKEGISLQLATEQGCQPLDHEHMISEYWKLRPIHNSKVSNYA